MSDLETLCAYLRDLADTLDACQWEHPLCSADNCRLAADELERIEAARVKLETEWNEIWDTIRECHINYDDTLTSAQKIHWLCKRHDELKDALETLMDEQNGAPLHRRAREWHAAMAEACRLTGRVKDQKRHNEAAAPAAKE